MKSFIVLTGDELVEGRQVDANGAFVARKLHGMGFDTRSIKFMCRWKSDSFERYLRDLSMVCELHTRSFDKAAAMPHFV